jgi:succinate-semialdehyde dehydrogenase/glutarate-semialdehyde dehydrogenase
MSARIHTAALLPPSTHSCPAVLLYLVLLQVYDAFAELVSAKVSALRVGDGMSADTTHGPLITPAGVEKVCVVGDGQGSCTLS